MQSLNVGKMRKCDIRLFYPKLAILPLSVTRLNNLRLVQIIVNITTATQHVGIPNFMSTHEDVIKWKSFPRYWPFVRGIHRSPVNSPHKGQWRGALMFTLICTRINGWVNNCEAGHLRRNRAHYDIVMWICWSEVIKNITNGLLGILSHAFVKVCHFAPYLSVPFYQNSYIFI